MQSALASLQGDSSLEQQLSEALASWAQAQAHAAALETDNTALVQRLEQAQAAVDAMRASSTQEWAGGKERGVGGRIWVGTLGACWVRQCCCNLQQQCSCR